MFWTLDPEWCIWFVLWAQCGFVQWLYMLEFCWSYNPSTLSRCPVTLSKHQRHHQPFRNWSNLSLHTGFLLKLCTHNPVELKVSSVWLECGRAADIQASWKSVGLLGQKLGADVAAVSCCWFTSSRIPAYLQSCEVIKLSLPASTDRLSETQIAWCKWGVSSSGWKELQCTLSVLKWDLIRSRLSLIACNCYWLLKFGLNCLFDCLFYFVLPLSFCLFFFLSFSLFLFFFFFLASQC